MRTITTNLGLFFLIGFTAQSINAQALFEDQATALGADVAYGTINLGAGISFYDYNGDGLDDITLASSSTRDFTFLRNIGGSFVEDNLGIHSNGFQSRQVIWADFDNDGDADFFSASDQDLSRLYRNDGGSFTDITASCGLPGITYDTFGASWGDYNNDGNLDLFLSIRDGGQTIPNILYRNNGDGTFTNVTVSSGLETASYFSFCASFFDMDKDGHQDIYVANDKFYKPNLLYHNNGDGTFENTSVSSGTAVSMDAMSTTIGDYDLDGDLDVYVTNSYPSPAGGVIGNALLRNNGDNTFTNVAMATGTEFNSNGWGAVFLDADNEGYPDLYVSGHGDGSFGLLPSAFYENQGNGTYVIPQNIGFENDTRVSFSNAIGDVDNDGYPEIIVMNGNFETMNLWKNLSPQNHNWLKIKLQGTQSNRMGIGSFIEVSAGGHVQFQYTICGEGYLSQNSGYEFFGLNDATQVDYIKVTWLSGMLDYIEDVDVNQHLTIVEGSGILGTPGDKSIEIGMSPNPADGEVTFNFPFEMTSEILFYDLGGKLVLTKNMTGKEAHINVQEMAAGMYMVKINTEKGVIHKKLVVE